MEAQTYSVITAVGSREGIDLIVALLEESVPVEELARRILSRELYPALKRAGVPRVGPTGEKRTFHSFRHSFARVALESGTELTWLSRHLGHSSTAVTDTVYGHWGRAARKRQMKRLAGAFTV